MANWEFMQLLPPPVHSLRLSLHGPSVSLQVGAGAVAPLERKLAALLAYVHHEGQTSRARLAGLLWPEASNEGARGNLRQCIARLRKLSDDVLVDSGGQLTIGPTVSVEAPMTRDALLLEPFDYADCDDFARWLDGQHQTEQSRRRATLMAEIKDAIQRGDLELAQTRADTLLALDRESEDSYRALMEVAYLRGDFAAAIAVWDRCRDMLRKLYDVTPSATTRDLGEMVLAASRQGEERRVASTALIPLSVLRPPRFVARSVELDTMLAAWRDGGIVCVCGEAGMGKSRLLAEFVGALGGGVSVAARPGDAVKPYAALGRLVGAAIERYRPPLDGDNARWVARLLPSLAHLVPDTPIAPLQTDRERGLALQALSGVLTACVHRGCSVFTLDDLQYADRATLEALPALVSVPAGSGPGACVDVVAPRFAFGSRLDVPDAPATVLLAAWASSASFTRIDLAPLADSEIRELLTSLDLPIRQTAELAARLRAQVGGNPAFLLESLKLLLSLGTSHEESALIPVAPGIEVVVQRRVGLLSAQARHIAQLAAIAGSDYTVAMAAAALACPVFALTEPLRELELRQVLYGRQFVHDLVASAVLRSIPAAVAEFMQRFVAEYLESRDSDPALIASHWRACGEWRRAGQCFMRAATASAAAIRPREQAEFLDAAAECFERSGSNDDLFDAFDERLEVMEVADRIAVRGRLIGRLDSLARTEEQHLRALLRRVGPGSEHALTQGLAELQDGLRRAEALGNPRLAFEFCEPISTRMALQGELDEAVALIGAFVPWAETQPDLRLRGRMQRALAVVHTLCDRLSPAVEYGDRAIALFRVAGDDLMRLPTMSNIGLMRHWRGELQAAHAILKEASVLRDRLHGSGSALVIEMHLAAVLRDLGEFSDANDRFDRLAAQLRSMTEGSDEPPTDLVIVENHHAQLWLMLGQPARALESLRVDDSRTDLRFRARRLALRLRAARLQGADSDALREAAGEAAQGLTSAFNRAWIEVEWFRSLSPSEGAEAFSGLYEQAAVRERPALQLQVALRAAEAKLMCGEPANALGWAQRAIALLETHSPFDMDADEAWTVVQAVLGCNGQEAAAQRALRRAVLHVDATAARLPSEWRGGYLQSRAEPLRGTQDRAMS